MGVALSSRNEYLSNEELQEASKIYQSLKDIKQMGIAGEVGIKHLKQSLSQKLNQIKYSKVEYISIAQQSTLEEMTEILQKPAILSLAVWIGKTRLIDNIIIK